jgi:hypothetical protein
VTKCVARSATFADKGTDDDGASCRDKIPNACMGLCDDVER